METAATLLYLAAFGVCSWAAVGCLRRCSPLVLLWLFLSYYSIYLTILSIAPSVLGDEVIGYLRGNEHDIETAAIFFGCTFALVAGNEFVRVALKPKHQNRQRNVQVDRFDLLIVSAIVLAAAAASLLSSTAESYTEYVSGSIGLSVTFAMLAAVGAGAAVLTRRAPLVWRLLLAATATLPSLLIFDQTAVRGAILWPLGAMLMAAVVAGHFSRLKAITYCAMWILILPIHLVNSYWLMPARGALPGQASLPESNVVGYFVGLQPSTVAEGDGILDPLSRFLRGLISWPVDRMGYDVGLDSEPAHFFAQRINKSNLAFDHMPMTFVLDFKFAAGWWALGTALMFGLLLGIGERVLMNRIRLLVFLLPALASVQFMFARGAITGAGSSVSAVVTLALGAWLTLWLVRGVVFESPNGRSHARTRRG